MQKLRILILYPEPAGLALLTSMLKSLGYIIDEASNDRIAVRLMERENIDLVLAGVDPGDDDALELLTYVRRKHRDVPVVFLFPRLHPERAKEALLARRHGGIEVSGPGCGAAGGRPAGFGAVRGSVRPTRHRPERPGRIRPVSARRRSPRRSRPPRRPPSIRVLPGPTAAMPGVVPALAFQGGGPRVVGGQETGPTVAGVIGPRGGHPDRPRPRLRALGSTRLLVRELGLIGNDPAWRQVVELAATVAASRSPVLISGEPGTGKSQLARLIHAMGSGLDRPFIVCEAAAMADELSSRRGRGSGRSPGPAPADAALIWAAKVNLARGGSLFIDDVAGLPDRPCSSTCSATCSSTTTGRPGISRRPGDVRFLMSTSENLPALVEQGQVPPGPLPPHQRRLPEAAAAAAPRRPTSSCLAEHFRARFAQRVRQERRRASPATPSTSSAATTGRATSASWRASIQRGVALCQGPRITSGHLAPEPQPPPPARAARSAPRGPTSR